MTMPAFLGDPNAFAVPCDAGGPVARLRAAAARHRQQRILRRQYAYLLACDERLLHGIGLTRVDVHRAIADRT